MEWRAAPLVREGLERHGKGVRRGMQGGVQHSVRGGLARDGGLRRVRSKVGRAPGEAHASSSAERLILGVIAGGGLCVLVALVATGLLLLWIIVDLVARSLALGLVIALAGWLCLRLTRRNDPR